jgi:hypothetical protein
VPPLGYGTVFGFGSSAGVPWPRAKEGAGAASPATWKVASVAAAQYASIASCAPWMW